MSREVDAHFTRTAKLAVIAAAIDVCMVGASILLRGDLRQIAAGVAAGLTLSAALMLIHAYRRRGPDEPSFVAAARKARQSAPAVVGAALLGGAGAAVLRALGAVAFFAGFFVGLFGFFALMVSPLFWTRPSPRVDTSPRAQMTNAERAVNLHYE